MATIMYVNGTEKKLKPPIDLKSLQTAVGGYIEKVEIPGSSKVLIVNEEGLLKKLPVNRGASATACQLIVGDVVVCTPSELG